MPNDSRPAFELSIVVNLPNALTILRIFLVPLLVVVLFTRTHFGVFVGAAIFGVAVATDYLDGYLARRRNQITRLGILLDPIADKLLMAAAFLSLVEMDLVPAWMVMIILGREIAVTGLRNLALGRGVLIPASRLGKWKMVSQVVAVFSLLFSGPAAWLLPLAKACLWVAVALTLASGIDYFWRFFRGDASAEREPNG